MSLRDKLIMNSQTREEVYMMITLIGGRLQRRTSKSNKMVFTVFVFDILLYYCGFHCVGNIIL